MSPRSGRQLSRQGREPLLKAQKKREPEERGRQVMPVFLPRYLAKSVRCGKSLRDGATVFFCRPAGLMYIFLHGAGAYAPAY